jgi:aspartate aminotransferase
MNQIASRVLALADSATIAMSQKSAELKAQGIDVINMSIGEPDFNTPEFIKEAAKKAIDDNFSHYTPIAGYLSLRQAICDKLKRENNLSYEPANIVVGNGAKHELCNVVVATINAGDEVIIPVPAWVSYVEMVKLAEGVPVCVMGDPANAFKITPEQLRSVITPKSKMIILNTPSNPTGAIYTADELKALADVLREYPDILIIADEIYEHISYRGTTTPSIATLPDMMERTVIINGVSKAYAMTGWRMGYMAGPLKIAKAVSKLQGQYTSGTSSIAQKASEAAYNGPQDCVEEMRKAFENRRNLIVKLAHDIPGWSFKDPEGAFYLFPDVSYYIGKKYGDKVINTSGDYVMYLLEEGHVACVDGAAFEAPGYIRLSYATSEELIAEALRRIKEVSAKLV